MRAKNAWKKYLCTCVVAGLLAVVLGVAVASAEVCTTPLLTINLGTQVTCGFVNAFAYGGVTVSIQVIAADTGTSVAARGATPIAALRGSALTSESCGTPPCQWFCRFEVTGNESFEGYSRGTIQNWLVFSGVLVGGALPAQCNPF
jgi:hypothetical protein